ncbi:Fibrinogen C domain-containing protein 1 [Halocaridina rubra]|uniref:Fibrinogen C domain-containing protein 1 n=1 Tax=Halocaridina rubra TaxID=373956 RepID=A0AAN8WNB1_HALRR
MALRTAIITTLPLLYLNFIVGEPEITDSPIHYISYEEGLRSKDVDTAYVIGEAVANEFNRYVPALSDNLRSELSGIRNDINRQFNSLKIYMDDKLERIEREAPLNDARGDTSTPSHSSIVHSHEAMIRHNLAMAELRRLGADLTKAMNEEVGKLRDEFRTSLDLLRERVENSTQGMASRLEGEFTLRSEESVNMLKKVFFLTRSQMGLIQSQLNNISASLQIAGGLGEVVDTDNLQVSTLSSGNETKDTTTTTTVSFVSTTFDETTTNIITSSVPVTTLMPKDIPRDCMAAKLQGSLTSGVTLIRPNENREPQRVWCDQETDGGGWTVMVRRQPQSIQLDFKRSWQSYRNGFGDPDGEYWIGLEALHQLTKNTAYSLRIDIKGDGEEATSLYDYFSVGEEQYGSRGYELEVGGYNEASTAGDAMEYHNGMDFSTYDEDNDGASGGSCANWSGGGGWWYNYCYYSNPTGIYAPEDLPPNSKADHFLEWRKWQGYYAYLSHLVMMIRPQ